MIFRKATTADIGPSVEIMNDAIRRLGEQGVDQWQHGYPNRDRIVQDVEEGIGWVLCQGEEVVAYGALVLSGEPSYANIADGQWLTQEENYAVVHRMCVKQSHIGKGYGRQFMAEAEHEAAKHKLSMRIDTHADNQIMQRMVRQMGYTYCGIIYFESRYLTAFEKILYYDFPQSNRSRY